MKPTPHALGIDLGGSKIEGVLLPPAALPCDPPVWRKRIPTPRPHDYDAILRAVAGLVCEGQRHLPQGSACAIGIGIPGAPDPETRLVRNANTTVLIGKPLAWELQQLLNQPVAMENDANCFALAEARFGAGQGYDMVFGVIMGTGCGGGLCLQGKVRQGPQHIAGEWGHMVMAPHGAPCYCGKRGCVETMLSGGGVEAAFQRLFGEHLSMQQIADGARNGEPRCKDVFERFLKDFGRCLGAVVSLLDPDCVVLGGGLSGIDELYTTGAAHMRHYVFHENPNTPLLRNKLGDSAGVFGAALVGAALVGVQKGAPDDAPFDV